MLWQNPQSIRQGLTQRTIAAELYLYDKYVIGGSTTSERNPHYTYLVH